MAISRNSADGHLPAGPEEVSFGCVFAGHPSATSLAKAREKSRKKAASSLAYDSAMGRNLGSVLIAMSVGSIVRVWLLVSVYCRLPPHWRGTQSSSRRFLKYLEQHVRGVRGAQYAPMGGNMWQSVTSIVAQRGTGRTRY